MIMFTDKTCIKIFAFLACMLFADRAVGLDFPINIDSGFPTVTSGPTNPFTTLHFQYSYNGLENGKSIDAQLLRYSDCTTALTNPAISYNAIVFPSGPPVSGKLTMDVKYQHNGIATPTIPDDGLYSSSGFYAYIKFCVRVNLKLGTESLNAHFTRVTVKTDLKAGCTLCPIDLQNTFPTELEVTKDLADNIICSLCDDVYHGQKKFFKQGDILTICLEYLFPSAGICIDKITSASLTQSFIKSPKWWDCLDPFKECWFLDLRTRVNLNLANPSITDIDCSGCTCRLKTVIGSRWFDPPNPGNPLSFRAEVLLEYGNGPDGQRRLGEPQRRLAEKIIVPVNLPDGLSLVDCKAIEKDMKSTKAAKQTINTQIKAAKRKGNVQLVRKLNAKLRVLNSRLISQNKMFKNCA